MRAIRTLNAPGALGATGAIRSLSPLSALILSGLLGAIAVRAQDPIPRAGLELWIRADSVKVQDGKVAQLYDLSGKNNHPVHDAKNGMDPLSPAVIPKAYNGHPALRFSSKYTGYSFANIANIRTVIAVLSKDSTSCLPTLPNYKTPAKFFLGQDDGVTNFHPEHGCSLYNANLGEVSPLLVNGKTYINGKAIADGRKTFFPFKLGIVTMVPTGNVKANTIARDRTMSDRSWQGDIAELLIYDTPLDDAARKGAEDFLMAKYGINGVVAVRPRSGDPEGGAMTSGSASVNALASIRPLADGAEIRFSASRADRARLVLMDWRGRSLRAFPDLSLPAGESALHWDGKDADGRRAAPGAYIAELAPRMGGPSRRLFLLR